MARPELPLCITCGAWSPHGPPVCGHAHEPHLSWLRPPWWDGLPDLLGMAVFTVLFAAVLIGVGPLIWSLFYDWPPHGAIEWFGVIGVGLVSLPGAVIGIGLILSIPEHWRGRCWHLRDTRADADHQHHGFIIMRRGAPHRGRVTHTVRAPLPAPGPYDMSSKTAARHTGEPRLLLAAAVADLAARGRLALALSDSDEWSIEPPDSVARRYRSATVHLRNLSSQTGDLPPLERRLLDRLAPGVDHELAALNSVLATLAADVGFTRDDDGDVLWPDADEPPSRALRRLLLDADPPPTDDPAPVRAALDTWRARDPERLGILRDRLAALADTHLPTRVADPE